MNNENNISSGRCQCGDISFTFDKSKIISIHHCHCKDCQRATGSGKATICTNCGSGILSYAKEFSRIFYIKVGVLDDSSWIKVDSNFFTKSASDWSKPDKSIKCFEGNPSLLSGLKTIIKSLK